MKFVKCKYLSRFCLSPTQLNPKPPRQILTFKVHIGADFWYATLFQPHKMIPAKNVNLKEYWRLLFYTFFLTGCWFCLVNFGNSFLVVVNKLDFLFQKVVGEMNKSDILVNFHLGHLPFMPSFILCHLSFWSTSIYFFALIIYLCWNKFACDT